MRKIVRDRILNKCKHKCVICGSNNRLEVDHIIPLSSGGLHSEENFQILCKSCNCSKGKKNPFKTIKAFIKNDPSLPYIEINQDILKHPLKMKDIVRVIELALKNDPQFMEL